MERVAKMQNEVVEIMKCCRRNIDTGKRQNVLARNASRPDNPRSAARMAAQDLVGTKKQNKGTKRQTKTNDN